MRGLLSLNVKEKDQYVLHQITERMNQFGANYIPEGNGEADVKGKDMGDFFLISITPTPGSNICSINMKNPAIGEPKNDYINEVFSLNFEDTYFVLDYVHH